MDAMPVNTEPVNTGPVNTEPVNTGPVNTGPVNTGPVNTGPVNTGPDEHVIRDEATLEALYGAVSAAALAKEVDFVHPHYAAMIAASPFMVLATSGPGGLDASPRGDPAGFVHVADERTLLIPDRRGNNRIDSLRNIVNDPRVALLFLIPGCGETLRVNGHATISVAPDLLARFEFRGTLPRSVIVVRVDSVYFQCPKALVRSELWNPAKHISRRALPSTGTIMADITAGRVGGEQYDREYPERLRQTLY